MTHRLMYYDGKRPQAQVSGLVVNTASSSVGIGTDTPNENHKIHIFRNVGSNGNMLLEGNTITSGAPKIVFYDSRRVLEANVATIAFNEGDSNLISMTRGLEVENISVTNSETSLVTSGKANIHSIVIGSPSGTASEGSGAITLDFNNCSYKVFGSVATSVSSISAINAPNGAQGVLYISPETTITISPFTGSSLYSTAVVTSGKCLSTVVVINGNALVSFSEII